MSGLLHTLTHTSIHNKDFDMSKYKNLGLVRIQGSMPAEVGTQLLKQHLSDFSLNLEATLLLSPQMERV